MHEESVHQEVRKAIRKKFAEHAWETWADKETWEQSAGEIAHRAFVDGFLEALEFKEANRVTE